MSPKKIIRKFPNYIKIGSPTLKREELKEVRRCVASYKKSGGIVFVFVCTRVRVRSKVL